MQFTIQLNVATLEVQFEQALMAKETFLLFFCAMLQMFFSSLFCAHNKYSAVSQVIRVVKIVILLCSLRRKISL